MHANANIAYLKSESEKLLKTVLDVQPRVASKSTSPSGENEEGEEEPKSEDAEIIDLITQL